MPLYLSSHFLQSSTPLFTQSSSQNYNFPQPWLPSCHLCVRPFTRISCVSTTRPRRKSTADTESSSEAAGLVRLIVRSFSDREPLAKTLNKYVRIVRTQHCFLLFEELGKSDKWLQCLEVTLCLSVFSLWVSERLFNSCPSFSHSHALFFYLIYCK